MVQENAVRETLCPWLGTAFLSWCDVCNQACGLLNGADCSQAGLDALYGALDRLLFHTLRDGTRGDMRILLDDGRTVRVRLDDVDQMADDVLYLALADLARTPWQYGQVRQFALTHSSLAALRALYTGFAAFQTQDELRLIARTIRSCHPAFRWRGWLAEQD